MCSRHAGPVRLVCLHCGSGFRHRSHRHADGLDMVMWLLGGAVLALGLVLLAQVGGYIELRNLATAPHRELPFRVNHHPPSGELKP